MTVKHPQKPPFFIYYRTGDHVAGASILIVVASVTMFFGYHVSSPFTQLILAGVVLACGVFAIGLSRARLRYNRHNGWYVCFDAPGVQINLFDYANSTTAPASDAAVLEVDANQILWIRKTIKPRMGDDPAEYYVDFRVSHQTWTRLKQARAEFLPEFDLLQDLPGHINLRFFEADIVRVRLYEKSWPEDLFQHWEAHNYNVINDYVIELQGSDINPSDLSPRARL